MGSDNRSLFCTEHGQLGLGAMVGAWRCDGEAKEQAVPMGQLPLMNEIAHYNEVDCKLMMEIVCYLRASH